MLSICTPHSPKIPHESISITAETMRQDANAARLVPLSQGYVVVRARRGASLAELFEEAEDLSSVPLTSTWCWCRSHDATWAWNEATTTTATFCTC